MSVVSKDELIKKISGIIGESTDDSAIALLEDVTDTINDYESKTKDKEDWKAKYEQNDKEWREKYKARFMQPTDMKDEEQEHGNDDEKPPLKTKVEELFKEKK